MDVDQLKIAALAAAFFINWRCLIAAAVWLADGFVYDSTNTGAQLSFWLIILYCLPALLNIKFSYKIHQGFLLLAAVNWLSLIDYTVFDYETTFYLLYPWIIHGIDIWIIWQFLSSGGNQNVGLLPENCVEWLRILFSLGVVVYCGYRVFVGNPKDEQRHIASVRKDNFRE